MSETRIVPGQAIPCVTVTITRALIDTFGDIANDRNPIHFDDAFARTRGFAGAIAHGAVSASFLFEMMARWMPDWPLPGDDIQISFVAPVLAGETLTARGTVERIEADAAICEVWCEKADGQKAIVGKARLDLPRETGR